MRRFQPFRTGTSKSSGEDRQAALTQALGEQAEGLNGNLVEAGVLGDGTVIQGNSKTTLVPDVTFQKPGVAVFVHHGLGYTVYNWSVAKVTPAGTTLGLSRRRPTRQGIWLEAEAAGVDSTGAVDSRLDAAGKFSPVVKANIKVWGEPGQEPAA